MYKYFFPLATYLIVIISFCLLQLTKIKCFKSFKDILIYTTLLIPISFIVNFILSYLF